MRQNLDSGICDTKVHLLDKEYLLKAFVSYFFVCDGRESEWTPGVGDGQGGLTCCDSWGCEESDTTEWLNWKLSISGHNEVSPLQLISYSDYQIYALDTLLKTLKTTRADRYRSRVKTHNMKNDQESCCEFPFFFLFFLKFSVFIQEQIKMGNYSKCYWQNPQERSISQDRRQERKPPWAREHEENTHSYSFFFFSLFFFSPIHHRRAGKRESPYKRQEVGKECFTKRGAVFQMYFSPFIFPHHIVSKADTFM